MKIIILQCCLAFLPYNERLPKLVRQSRLHLVAISDKLGLLINDSDEDPVKRH